MVVSGGFIQEIGKAVKAVAKGKGSKWWYTPHVSAASRAVADRLPLVDLVVEVRDARIPLSSKYEQLSKFPASFNRVIVLNKMDLASRSRMKDWIKFFQEQKCMAFAVNSHNRDNIKEFLTFLQARVRELKKNDEAAHTITLMLVGIPNVGKSALTNSLHQVGRISAAEKGRLRHSVVSPLPGETKGISSLKIASHPNIYVLDTPGVLPPNVIDDEVCSKLALTGAINDDVAVRTKDRRGNIQLITPRSTLVFSCELEPDFVVNSVRRALFDSVSSFAGCVENEEDLVRLKEHEFEDLGSESFLLRPKSRPHQRNPSQKFLPIDAFTRSPSHQRSHRAAPARPHAQSSVHTEQIPAVAGGSLQPRTSMAKTNTLPDSPIVCFG
ncbi:P-loop containing nucleoside triphosphatehydrolases superfamily protein [Striga asiatica]|uniref:P-loop containing nucleoside triphosphatehydrolases superfamily protein n=1 Tax=Striga asiatica TaxID=4170 RepID=A0A5A7RJK3_STRAF|nr:P-loop containing nucleoside triphosphatehydrolases superfamily protein [Striga asiatica]